MPYNDQPHSRAMRAINSMADGSRGALTYSGLQSFLASVCYMIASDRLAIPAFLFMIGSEYLFSYNLIERLLPGRLSRAGNGVAAGFLMFPVVGTFSIAALTVSVPLYALSPQWQPADAAKPETPSGNQVAGSARAPVRPLPPSGSSAAPDQYLGAPLKMNGLEKR